VSNQAFYLSLDTGQTIGGIAAQDIDILYFDGASWSLFFDASDLGISTTGHDLNDFYIVDADTILLTFGEPITLGTLSVDSWDIVQFDATSLGSNTAGTFSLYFDGEDVGLDDTANESVEGLDILPDGRILISTDGNFVLPGLSGKDEDIVAFTPITLGANTSGTWSMYLDGSAPGIDLGDTSEDVDSFGVAPNGTLYLSTDDIFSVTNVAGDNEDVFVCAPVMSGNAVSSCTYSSILYFDGSAFGLDANDVDAIDLP